jgi:hypothetical protein
LRFGRTRPARDLIPAPRLDFTLTDRSAQKGVLAAPDRASFGDMADSGSGVTPSLLPPSRSPTPGGRAKEHSFLPLGEARLGRIGFDEWLLAHRQEPDPGCANRRIGAP